jgi:hypothetical protein
MVEPAVAQYRVELPVAEGHVLGFAQNEPEIAAGGCVSASLSSP